MTHQEGTHAMGKGVSMKQYVDALQSMAQRERDHDQHWQERISAERNQDIADKLSKMNEIRGALSDAQAQMVTRTEHDALISSIHTQMTSLSESMNREFKALNEYKALTQGGASSHQVTVVQSIALAGVLLSLISTGVGTLGLVIMVIHLYIGK